MLASSDSGSTVLASRTNKRQGGVYRVPHRGPPGDLTWRNSLDSAVLVKGDSDDESSEEPHRDEEPRSGMNSRDRRRDTRKHRQLEYKPQKPSKQSSYNAELPPKSYNAEPHNYETPSE